ncbi:MAG: CBS domain-containing protein [Planctomycetota bacterium]
MHEMFDRIVTLRVSDVMSRNPTTVEATASMNEVSHLFAEKRIHSAPVVDGQGQCVGIVTASDFVKRADQYAHYDDSTQQIIHDQEGLHSEPKSYEFVSDCMTTGIQAISPDTHLITAGRVMVDAHLHVLPVIEHHRPVGMLSNLDLVAALVNAFDEAKRTLT